jgi:hypothetical protein
MKIWLSDKIGKMASGETVIPGVNLDKGAPIGAENAANLGKNCRNVVNVLECRPREDQIEFTVIERKGGASIPSVCNPAAVVIGRGNAVSAEFLDDIFEILRRLFMKIQPYDSLHPLVKQSDIRQHLAAAQIEHAFTGNISTKLDRLLGNIIIVASDPFLFSWDELAGRFWLSRFLSLRILILRHHLSHPAILG